MQSFSLKLCHFGRRIQCVDIGMFQCIFQWCCHWNRQILRGFFGCHMEPPNQLLLSTSGIVLTGLCPSSCGTRYSRAHRSSWLLTLVTALSSLCHSILVTARSFLLYHSCAASFQAQAFVRQSHRQSSSSSSSSSSLTRRGAYSLDHFFIGMQQPILLEALHKLALETSVLLPSSHRNHVDIDPPNRSSASSPNRSVCSLLEIVVVWLCVVEIMVVCSWLCYYVLIDIGWMTLQMDDVAEWRCPCHHAPQG